MKKIILSAFILILFILNINAQCGITNNAFQAGEELTYDVYFKYGLIHKKAGLATLKIKNDTYKSRDAYRMSMIANSTGLAKKIFTLSDTMFCYMSKAIEPLSYTKYAHEGSDHTREFITYDYSSGNVNVHAKLTRNDKLRHDTIITSTQCYLWYDDRYLFRPDTRLWANEERRLQKLHAYKWKVKSGNEDKPQR